MIEQGAVGRSLRNLRLPARSRRRPAGRSRAGRRRLRLRVLAGLVVAAALLAGGWVWLRTSPLVSVQRVTITGLSGAEAPQIRAALTDAARGMTTLDVHTATLRAAVGAYPVVKGLKVSPSFPHDLRIAVEEQLPVAAVWLGTRQIPVAADGTVLHDGEASGPLPTLSLKAIPGGPKIEDATARLELAVLAAAPAPMLSRVSGVSTDYWHGVVITVRQGPAIYFGGGDRLSAKWQAAMAVIAAASTAGASYVDVSDPQRPAAGPANPAGATGATSGASSAASATSAGATAGTTGGATAGSGAATPGSVTSSPTTSTGG